MIGADMRGVRIGLSRGLNAFKMINPAYPALFKPVWMKATFSMVNTYRRVKMAESSSESTVGRVENYIGVLIGQKIVLQGTIPIGGKVLKLYAKSPSNVSHLFDPKRSWFEKKGKIRVAVVYHEANRAGKHIDIHFSDGTSFIMRVTGKPVESLIKFNGSGKLTEESKKAILDHIRSEIATNSRVPQNLDHDYKEARMVWNEGDGPTEGYGSGNTRQLIMDTDGVIFKMAEGPGETIEMFIPEIDPHNAMYIHRLAGIEDNRAPVAIWGNLKPTVPEFNDRLHLKMIQPEDEDKFLSKIDPKTLTRKYDGASAYIWVSKKGTKLYSPRISKTTGKRIEYTDKVWELADIYHEAEPTGMGELLFKRTLFGMDTGEYLSSAEIGGILNSNSLRPNDTIPEFRLYRIDKWNGEDVSNLPFWQNRRLQVDLSTKHPFLKVVDLVKDGLDGWEGVVAAPYDQSINNGYKIKYWQDANDWEVIGVDLSLSEKGNAQGVVLFKSLESNREFKLGPGQVGTFDECMDIIDHPDAYIGRVGKVQSRVGHEGRSSKLLMWHDDKGTAP